MIDLDQHVNGELNTKLTDISDAKVLFILLEENEISSIL